MKGLPTRPIAYSPHALLQIRDSGITKEAIRGTLRSPQRTVAGRRGRVVAEKVFNGRLLRVVYESDREIVVVTAYWAEEERYWRG